MSHEHDTASGEGMPDRPARDESPAPESDTVLVRLDGPFWCTAFNVTDDDGGTLVIDRTGVEVSRDSLPDLQDTAARQGVTLSTEGE